MKNTGIWIDKHEAIIVFLEADKQKTATITSQIDDYKDFEHKVLGQSDNYTNDKKFLERTKQQTKNYIKKIAAQLKKADNIVILGPSTMPGQLKKMLDENYKLIGQNVKEVQKTPKLSENQIIAWVKEYYNLPKSSS